MSADFSGTHSHHNPEQPYCSDHGGDVHVGRVAFMTSLDQTIENWKEWQLSVVRGGK